MGDRRWQSLRRCEVGRRVEDRRVDATEWEEIRNGLRDEAHRWLQALGSPRDATDVELSGMIASIAHLAYHLGAIRQINKQARGPKRGNVLSRFDGGDRTEFWNRLRAPCNASSHPRPPRHQSMQHLAGPAVAGCPELTLRAFLPVRVIDAFLVRATDDSIRNHHRLCTVLFDKLRMALAISDVISHSWSSDNHRWSSVASAPFASRIPTTTLRPGDHLVRRMRPLQRDCHESHVAFFSGPQRLVMHVV